MGTNENEWENEEVTRDMTWLETYLCMYCNHQKDNWAQKLHLAEFAWNNHYHESIKMTPFYANYGRHPVLTDQPPLDQLPIPGRIERIHEVALSSKSTEETA